MAAPQGGFLDLHGLTWKQSVTEVDNILIKGSRRENSGVIEICTGTGKHCAEGGPTLRPKLKDYLSRRHDLWFTEVRHAHATAYAHALHASHAPTSTHTQIRTHRRKASLRSVSRQQSMTITGDKPGAHEIIRS